MSRRLKSRRNRHLRAETLSARNSPSWSSLSFRYYKRILVDDLCSIRCSNNNWTSQPLSIDLQTATFHSTPYNVEACPRFEFDCVVGNVHVHVVQSKLCQRHCVKLGPLFTPWLSLRAPSTLDPFVPTFPIVGKASLLPTQRVFRRRGRQSEWLGILGIGRSASVALSKTVKTKRSSCRLEIPVCSTRAFSPVVSMQQGTQRSLYMSSAGLAPRAPGRMTHRPLPVSDPMNLACLDLYSDSSRQLKQKRRATYSRVQETRNEWRFGKQLMTQRKATISFFLCFFFFFSKISKR